MPTAAGVTVVDDHPAPLDPARAREWWQRFASHVRGRGRGAEQLADWLELDDIVIGERGNMAELVAPLANR